MLAALSFGGAYELVLCVQASAGSLPTPSRAGRSSKDATWRLTPSSLMMQWHSRGTTSQHQFLRRSMLLQSDRLALTERRR